MIYGYVRVSTGSQTTENQKLVIKGYCKQRRLHHIHWVAETISGTKQPSKRKLGELMKTVQKGDIVIITEISRLGRSMIMIMDVLQVFLDKEVKVYAIKEGFDLGDNIQSKVLAFAFGLCAEIERNLISERTKAGLARARKLGKKIGRAVGEKPKNYKLTPHKRKIKQLLKEGVSKSAIARAYHVQWVTLDRFMKREKIVINRDQVFEKDKGLKKSVVNEQSL